MFDIFVERVFHSRLIMKLKTNRIKHTFDVSDHIFVSACLHAYDHLLPVLIFLLGWKSSFLLLIFLCFFSHFIIVFSVHIALQIYCISSKWYVFENSWSFFFSVALIRSLSLSFIFSPIQFFFFAVVAKLQQLYMEAIADNRSYKLSVSNQKLYSFCSVFHSVCNAVFLSYFFIYSVLLLFFF